MRSRLSRRDFLKFSLLGLGSLAARPVFATPDDLDGMDIARVAIRQISVHSQPNEESRILFQLYRDELAHIYYEVESEHGPGYNPYWYRVWGGYIHRASTQRVRPYLNPVAGSIREGGQLGEITVPYSQALLFRNERTGWETLYRLYYGSTHWVMSVDEGPDGGPWYRLKDELLEIEYHVPAQHVRLIPDEEFAPLSPDVPAHLKRIEISIARQEVVAFERDQEVFRTRISSGLPYKPEGMIPWDTPKGSFNIYSKMPSKHMGDGRLTGNPEDYELPGVPWTCFFEETGVAFHGTYWHTDFGRPRSHGCINMTNEDAKWIFRWTTPVSAPTTIEQTGYGTQVIVY